MSAVTIKQTPPPAPSLAGIRIQSVVPNPGADLNGDGTVNTPDLDIVRDNFGKGTPNPAPTSNPDRDVDVDSNVDNPDEGETTTPATDDAAEDNASRDPEPTRPSKPAGPIFTPSPTTRPKPASPTLTLSPETQRAAAMRPTANALSLTRPGKSDAPAADTPAREITPARRFNALAMRDKR